MTANAGSAVFKAVADFGGLIREGKKAEQQLGKTEAAGRKIGGSVPADGGAAARGLQTIGRRATEMGDKTQNAGRKMTLSLTAPITLLGGVAIRTFANFESAIVSAGLKSGATAKQLGQMKQVALDMGAQTKFSAGEAADALDALAALGQNANQAIKTLPAVMQAAQASGEDLAMTTQTVAMAMNAFNINAGDSAHVADVFAQAANTTALNMQGLSDGLANAGEVGPRFGQSLESVVAWLGRLRDMGVPAASAGVAIRQSLTSLSAPTLAASNVIKGLGLQVRDAHGEMLPIPDLLHNVGKAFEKGNPALVKYKSLLGLSGDALNAQAKKLGLTSSQARQFQTALEQGGSAFKDYALKTIFGVEGAKAFSLALSEGKPVTLSVKKDTEQLTRLQDGLATTMGGKAAKAWIKAHESAGKFKASGADAVKVITALGTQSDGTSKKMSDAFQETLKQKIDNLTGSVSTLAIKLVDKVSPALKGAADKATKFLNKVGEFSDKNDWFAPVVLGLAAVLAAAGPVLFILGSIIKTFGRVTSGVGRIARLGRGKKGAAAAAEAGIGGAQSVFWTRAMPVYLTGPSSSKSGTPTSGGSSGAKGGKPGGRFGGVKSGLKRAGAAGLAGAGFSLLSGGSAKDAAKTAGLFAGIEVAVALVSKSFDKIGPKAAAMATKVGKAFLSMIKSGAKWVATTAAQMVKVAAKWAWVAVKALASGARMALAWTIGVIAAGAQAVASMVATAAVMAAKWAWMAAKALANAARMAAAWLIAMGPIGLIILAVIALAALIILKWDWIKKTTVKAWKAITGALGKAWDWIKKKSGELWDWVVAKVGWFIDKLLFWFTNFTVVGLIIKHWDDIKRATGVVWDWITDKISTFLTFFGTLPGKIAGFASGMWDGLKAGLVTILNWCIDKINGLISAFNKLPGVNIGLLGHVGEDPPPSGPTSSVGGQQAGTGGKGGTGSDPLLKTASGLRTVSTATAAGLPVRTSGRSFTPDLSGAQYQKFGSTRPSLGSPKMSTAGMDDRLRSGGKAYTFAPTIVNPLPERASQSVTKVLSDSAWEAGWS